MKRVMLFTLLISLLTSCSITYNYYVTTEPTTLYADESSSTVQGTIPANELIIEKSKKGKRNYVRYFNGSYAWLSLDKCTYKSKTTANAFKVSQSSASSSSSSTSSSSGGTVEVKGYYRKDGTYVQPHTRKVPRRKG